jgi:hypothetical protein
VQIIILIIPSLSLALMKQMAYCKLVVLARLVTHFKPPLFSLCMYSMDRVHYWNKTNQCACQVHVTKNYSLRPILLFANTDASATKMCLNTSTLAKSIMGRREYRICEDNYFLLNKLLNTVDLDEHSNIINLPQEDTDLAS